MKIIFNLYNVGLGNNGGSRTIIKCAETLSSLGQDVSLFVNSRAKFTWEKIGAKIIYGDTHPKCDISIATGFNSIFSTISSNSLKKYCYIRGLENWVVNERTLFSYYKKVRCIVNSLWLKEYFNANSINCKLIYPGLDFDRFYIEDGKRINILGALQNKKHRTKRNEDINLIERKYGLKAKVLNRDIKEASEKKLRLWYNSIKIWLSTSELEGLHNPPMEAGLCGCALVCTNHKRGGIADYAINNKTALIYPARNMKIASDYVKELDNNEGLRSKLNKNLREFLSDKIGSRRHNMSLLIKYIEEEK